jgi:hypothetical protein
MRWMDRVLGRRVRAHTAPRWEGSADPVQTWFDLSYSSYLVVNRTLLQSMPVEWQRRFVTAMEELQDAFAHIDGCEYEVMPGRWMCVEDCDPQMLALAGVTVSDGGPGCGSGFPDLEGARWAVDQYLASQGSKWEFTASRLHELLGMTLGRTRSWFMEEVADRLIEVGYVESVSGSTYQTTVKVMDIDVPEPTYYDKHGTELGYADRVFVPGVDPIPHYDRGRAHVEPFGGEES